MHLSYRVSTLQAGGGGVMLWGGFSWHTLGPLIKVEQCLNAIGYLNIIANQVHPFMAAVYPSVNGFLSNIESICPNHTHNLSTKFHPNLNFLRYPAYKQTDRQG